MRQATDQEKYFIYRTSKLANESNQPKIEGVIKAFGLIRDVDTKLTTEDKAKFEAIDELESLRGDTEPKVFLESLTRDAFKCAGKEEFGEVRKSLNYYRNWLNGKPNKVTLESLGSSLNPIDTTCNNYTLTTIHLITDDGDQQSVMATIQRLRDECGADGCNLRDSLDAPSAYVNADSGHKLEESREWIASKLHTLKSAYLSDPEYNESIEWIDEDSDHVVFAQKSNTTNNYDVMAYIATPAETLN